MILLDVEGISKHFAAEPVLSDVTFQIRPGERAALVGPNGGGKTTLLRILTGKEDSDGGACRCHAAVHLGYLEQQARFEPGRTLWDEAADALAPLMALQSESVAVAEAIAETDDADEHQRLASRYDHLQQELHRHDAYNLEHKIERVLAGLGFAKSHFKQSVGSLSGGEQNRLLLARLLLAEPNLMLLDEPSNHLDIEATEWLEDFLLESSAAMIVVSHDRYFLDKVCNRTLELLHGTVDSYAGNFSAYRRQKVERLLVQCRAYEKRETEIAKAKEFIRRNAYGQKHAQAEDRRKKLERLDPIERPREIATPPMAFGEPRRAGDVVLRVERLAKAYDRPLFSGLSFDIARGQRWALLGPNGCGKTTLLRCLMGLESPDEGTATLGHGVEVGYFDQHLDSLADEAEVVEAVRPPRGQMNEQQRRDLLARFGLTGDGALQRVGQLSGGERCRAALARLAAADANLLVLDEPTNHLDLWACDALQQALNAYRGTVLMVSHDRYFVDQVADHLLVVEPDRVRVVEGNYDTYRRLLDRRQAETVQQAKPAAAKSAAKADKPRESTAGKRRFPYRKVADLEAEIFTREGRVKQLQQQLAHGDTHRDAEQVRNVMAELADEEAALKTLYEHWDEATELNW